MCCLFSGLKASKGSFAHFLSLGLSPRLVQVQQGYTGAALFSLHDSVPPVPPPPFFFIDLLLGPGGGSVASRAVISLPVLAQNMRVTLQGRFKAGQWLVRAKVRHNVTHIPSHGGGQLSKKNTDSQSFSVSTLISISIST